MFAQQFDTFIATHRETFLEDLCNFIRIPSISLVDKSDGMREAVLFLQEHMQAAGCTTCVYDTEGNPIIFAEIGPEDAAFTLLIYGHYDVFPADDRQQWITDPFEPVILDDRIYGRGAGDNKGQILAHLQALKVVQQVCGTLPMKVKFLIEGEEETGSTHLPAFVREHQDELRADLCCYSDGPMFPGDQPILVFGVRGVVCMEFVARGARRVLHSGNFGGVAPNPVLDLCRLFSMMVSPDGQILVPGVEQGVPDLTDIEREALAALPLDREYVQKEMGLAPVTERYHQSFYERLLCRPSFNLAGFSGGFTGNGIKTIIPNEAIGKVDIRLVGDQDPDAIVACIRNFIEQHGFEGIEVRKLVGQPASKTPLDHPYAAIVRDCVAQGFERAPLIVPGLGATTPDYVFTKLLKIPSIVIPYAPHDENNHAPNESTKVSIYLKGIKTTAFLLTALREGVL
jgi:acetylornithine deacetylase/succinyl-diaminopimelate desuccinylase-like protein